MGFEVSIGTAESCSMQVAPLSTKLPHTHSPSGSTHCPHSLAVAQALHKWLGTPEHPASSESVQGTEALWEGVGLLVASSCWSLTAQLWG